MSRWSEASKQVGWEHRNIQYPTIDHVDKAFEQSDIYRLLEWHRHLQSPQNDAQCEVISCIEDRLRRVRAVLESEGL